MGNLSRSGKRASLVEDIVRLRSEYPYPNGFLRVLLLLTIHLILCEPRGLAIGLGERLGNTRRVWLLSVVPPVLGLPFLPYGFGASVVPPIRGKVHPGRWGRWIGGRPYLLGLLLLFQVLSSGQSMSVLFLQ